MTDYTQKAALPFAELLDPPNLQTYTLALATQLDSIVVPKFPTTTDRDTANTTPTDGDMAWVDSTDLMYLYRLGSWRALGDCTPVTLASPGTAATGWGEQGSVARKLMDGHLVFIHLYLDRTGATLVSTNGNFTDTLCYTLNSGWRPTERISCTMGNGLVTAEGIIDLDGTVFIRSASHDVTNASNLHVTSMFITA